MRTILLKFAGPLQSWGTSSKFETRWTDYYPSKSAVIGIVAACLGMDREDETIAKLNDLSFAVRIDRKGNLHRDYHIATKYKRNGDFEGTYVTNRYYLEDAVFVAAIGSEEDELIRKVAHALKNPYYQPYMGRRSLPLPPDFFISVESDDVLASLSRLDWQDTCNGSGQAKVRLEVYADAELVSDTKSSYEKRRRDRVFSFSQKNRQHSFRYERRTFVEVKNPLVNEKVETTHDPFASLGDPNVLV